MNLKTGISLLFFSSVCMGLAQADAIRIATQGDNPPFNMKDEKGQLVGFEVDLAMALCYQMKAECELVEQEKEGIIAALVEKKYDAVMARVPITTDPQKQVAFSEPYYSNYLNLIGKKDSDLGVSKTALKDKKLGAQRSTISARYLQDNYAEMANIKLYDAQGSAFEDLKSGQLDAVLVGAYEGYKWLINAESSDYDVVGEKIDVQERAGIVIRKDDNILKQKLDSALKTIVANGTYKRINWNYFPYDVF